MISSNCSLSPGDFDNFFTSVASDIIKSLATSPDRITESDLLSRIKLNQNSFFLAAVSPLEVADTIMTLKNSSCTDIYEISSTLIKASVDVVSCPLAELYNRCILVGQFPECLKISKVIPIFKNGDVNAPSDYRPISIVPYFGKVFEIILKKRLEFFLEKYKIINPNQFGFRRGRSTVQAVSKIVADIVGGLESGLRAAITLCDLTKAFDCVNHDLLLAKLHIYGIRGPALRLIKSYLDGRRQCVVFGNQRSDESSVLHGVPQGSVLGPLLFIVYVNDMAMHARSKACVLFADDTTLFTSCPREIDIEKLADEETRSIDTWCTSNYLKLNPSKTQRLTFTTLLKRDKKTVKMLGITLDECLSWEGHVLALRSRLSSIIFLMRRLSLIFNLNILKHIYFAVFHSHINYGIELWGNSTDAIKIFKLQKRVLRLMCRKSQADSCKPLLIKLQIMSLPSLYIYRQLLQIHSNKTFLKTHSSNHNYSTRSANLIMNQKYRLNVSVKNSVNYNLYNILPECVKELNFSKFKSTLKNYLISECYYSIDEFLTQKKHHIA